MSDTQGRRVATQDGPASDPHGRAAGSPSSPPVPRVRIVRSRNGAPVHTRGTPGDAGESSAPTPRTPVSPTDSPTGGPSADAPPAATAELAARAAAGCTEAFGQLVAPHEASLYRFLRVRAGNAADAEELAQETLLRAWTHIERFDPSRPFAPWLFTIAHRLASSLRRRNGRRPTTALPDELHDPRPDPAQSSQASEQRGRLWELASRVLSADQTTALWLRYAEDLAPAEIGRVLGRPGPAVRVLLFRARRALARHLEAPPLPEWTPAPHEPSLSPDRAGPQPELPR